MERRGGGEEYGKMGGGEMEWRRGENSRLGEVLRKEEERRRRGGVEERRRGGAEEKRWRGRKR